MRATSPRLLDFLAQTVGR